MLELETPFLCRAIRDPTAPREARATVIYVRSVSSAQALKDLHLRCVNLALCVMKRAWRYHTSDAQAAMFVVRVPLPTILIACSAFRHGAALLGLFVSREWLTTTHPTGCQALRWAHWLRSLVWKATSVPPILPLPWAVESAYRVTTAQRIPPYPFQHRQGPLLAKKEAPSSEVFVSQAHSQHGQGKSAALRVQREAPV